MRAVIQRVKNASVTVAQEEVGRIGQGLVILLGVGHGDGQPEIDYLAEKIVGLRIFADSEDRMNLSLKDIGGEALIVSQFTLYGNTRKGRRPSFMDAADPEIADRLYLAFVEKVKELGVVVKTGTFGAMMELELVNDGPVTLILESK